MKAIVTGGTRGIGNAVVRKLAELGFSISFCARSLDELSKTKNALLTTYPNQEFNIYSVDLTSKFEIKSFTDNVINNWGNVDLIVNNIGGFIPNNIEDEGLLNDMMAINFKAPYLITKPFIPLFKEVKQGTIINISSSVVKSVRTDASDYTIAKNAFHAWHGLLQKELRTFNVKVSSIIPGSVNTSSWNGVEGAELTSFIQPLDISNAVEFILKTSASSLVEEIVINPLDPNL